MYLEDFMKTVRVITAAILLIFVQSVFSQWEDDIPVTRKEMERRAVEKYLSDPDNIARQFSDDAEIDIDETIDGNVVIMDGDLKVYGHVMGDILALNGDVRVQRHGFVSGNITTVGGKIRQHEDSIVEGNQIETKSRNVFRSADYEEDFNFDFDFEFPEDRNEYKYSTLPMGPLDDQVIVRYNRVQGFFLGMEMPKSIAGKNNIATIHGFGGYGFKEKAWRYELGLDRYFFNQRDYRFELGAKMYDLTDTRDDWLITPTENSLASFLMHEDFFDFYRRKGFEVHASQNLSIFLKGTLAYRNDDYQSLDKNVDWALFGGKKKFRENPLISEGNMRSLYGELYLDTRNSHELPRRGWYGKIAMEMSNSGLKSDFRFNQYLIELRHYLPVSRGERLDFRVMAGSAEGDVPLQKLFQLGGLSTLRGYSYKEFSGDRMLLMNLEYNVSPSTFSRDILFFDDLRLIFFMDTGAAWFHSGEDKWYRGFDHLKFPGLKSDVGIAIADWKGQVRLNIAKRTDTNRDPLEVTFRIAKPF
jgi:hypothetical protein